MLSKEIFSKLKTISIIRTDRIGDVILTLPMFEIIKNINPNFRTILIASKYTLPLYQNNPYVDKYYCIEDISIIDINKKENIDLIFMPNSNFDQAWQVFKSKIKYRVGTKYRLYSILYNFQIQDHRKISQYHELEYNLRMISAITKDEYKAKLTPIYLKNISCDKFEHLKNKNFVIIHPGSGNSSRDISLDNWKLIIKLLLNKNINIVITGIEKEKHLCDELCMSIDKIHNYCGKLDLDETINLISYSKALFANSTGVIHIAAALDKITCGFYPNSPHIGIERWRPYNCKSYIVSPHMGDEMSSITNEQIESAVNEIIKMINNYE